MKSGKAKNKKKNKVIIKKNKEIIKKSIFKIVSFLVIISLNWAGLSVMGNTLSAFNDTENSPGNTFSASTLYFSLPSPADFSPDITPTQNTLKTININNDGSLDFDYNVKSNNVLGDLCSSLNLSANLDGVNKYTGSIDGFDYSAGQFTTVGGNWQFEINLTSSDLSLGNNNCTFDFIFDGLQIGGVGFSDQETISNTVNSGTWEITPPSAPDIVLNEILPNPDGTDNAPMPGGEWVELYNRGTADGDVNGWVLYDAEEDNFNELIISLSNTNTSGTTIAPGGFLVVYRNGDSDFALNNSGGDSVRLYNGSISSGGVLIDSYTYTITALSGKSFARIPDGSNNWVDPIPTPGAPNILEEETEEPIIEEPVAEEPVVVEETALVVETTPAEEVVLTEEVLVVAEPVLEEEIQPSEEPVQNQETIIEETEPVIEQSPVVEPEPVAE